MRMGCVDFASCVASAMAPLAMSAALAIAPVLSRLRRDKVIEAPVQLIRLVPYRARKQAAVSAVRRLLTRAVPFVSESRFRRATIQHRPRLPHKGRPGQSFAHALGTRRFQRAVSAEDLLIGIGRPQTGDDAYPGLVPINSFFAETARWKRRVPR